MRAERSPVELCSLVGGKISHIDIEKLILSVERAVSNGNHLAVPPQFCCDRKLSSMTQQLGGAAISQKLVVGEPS